MKWGLQLFGIPPHHYAPLAEHAESLGCDTVWLGDHLITPDSYESPYPYDASGRAGFTPSTPIVDVFVLLGHLAARTATVRLGTGVVILPLRNPFVVARAAGSIQDLSEGRLRLGLGIGWLAEEFAAVGESFDDRGRRFDEMIDILELLWRGGSVSHSGESYSFTNVTFTPTPCAPIDMVFGGTSTAALERAARRGSGWFSPHQPLQDLLPVVDRLRALRADVGVADRAFDVWVRMVAEASPDAVARYVDAGVSHLVIGPSWAARTANDTLGERLDSLSRAADILQKAS